MAYNMVMSIISCTQQQAQFYSVFLFKEDPAKVSHMIYFTNINSLVKQYITYK